MADGPPVAPTTGYESELTADRGEKAAALTGVTEGVPTGAIRSGTGDDASGVSVPADPSLEIEFEDGEGYTREHNAQKGLRSVVENSPDAGITEQSTD